MGKCSNKYSGSKMNRAARRRDEKEQIAAMELLLDAKWTGLYFVHSATELGNPHQYYTRDGKRISSIEANAMWEKKRLKQKPRLTQMRRGKSVTTQGNLLGPSLSRKGRDVMDGAFEPIHNDPLYHSTMGR